jgi:hypothetical protein
VGADLALDLADRRDRVLVRRLIDLDGHRSRLLVHSDR